MISSFYAAYLYKKHTRPLDIECIHKNDIINIETHLNRIVGNNNYLINSSIETNSLIHIEIIKRFDISLSGTLTVYDYPVDFTSYLDKYFRTTTNRKIMFTIVPHIPYNLLKEEIRVVTIKQLLLFLLSGAFIIIIISPVINKMFNNYTNTKS